MRPENRQLLELIFREVLRLEPSRSIESVRSGDSPTWDSLGHVSLIAAIESEFAIEIDLGESLILTSFGAAVELLTARGL